MIIPPGKLNISTSHCVKTDLGDIGIRYRRAVIWNLILQDGTNTDVSGAVFKERFKE